MQHQQPPAHNCAMGVRAGMGASGGSMESSLKVLLSVPKIVSRVRQHDEQHQQEDSSHRAATCNSMFSTPTARGASRRESPGPCTPGYDSSSTDIRSGAFCMPNCSSRSCIVAPALQHLQKPRSTATLGAEHMCSTRVHCVNTCVSALSEHTGEHDVFMNTRSNTMYFHSKYFSSGAPVALDTRIHGYTDTLCAQQ